MYELSSQLKLLWVAPCVVTRGLKSLDGSIYQDYTVADETL